MAEKKAETKDGRVLIVDDDLDVLQAAQLFLKRHVKEVQTESQPEVLPELLRKKNFDVILLDMNFTKDVASGREGFFWLDRILEADPTAVVILITAYGDVDLAVRAIKEGATDFVLKPWNNEKLLATLMSALNLRRARTEVQDLKNRQRQLNANQNDRFKDIIGQSPAILQVFDTIERVAMTDANVLILGENGTGKEVIARAIHRHSMRREEAFVNVDLGAISETLFESELFGHTKGSFTDAKEDRAGRFEVADRGTLFLDEIGNLSQPLQAKLLTVLQNRQVTRIGSNKARKVDIRLVCATNQPLYDMVDDGSFRQDLLYRINTIEVTLPPLRERGEDVVLLAEHFLVSFVRKYNKDIKGLHPQAKKKMLHYAWPGNVRELQHALERAVIMSDADTIQPEDLFLGKSSGDGKKGDGLQLDTYNLEDLEKLMIQKVLEKNQGNISNAAKELGLTRASLYRRLEKYGL